MAVAGSMAGPETTSSHHKALGNGLDFSRSSRQIPGAREPKTRPPTTLREKLLPSIVHCRLPKYTGPYSVSRRASPRQVP